eukprot:UN23597
MREAIAIDEHETAGKQTAGVIIQINPAPSRYDLYAEQNLKAIREANHETPGEIQDQTQAEPGSPKSVRSNDQKQQTYPDEQNELQKQIESVQKIPNLIRAHRQQQIYQIDNQDESQNADLSSRPQENFTQLPGNISPRKQPAEFQKQPRSDCQFNVQIHEDLLPNIQTAVVQLSQNLIQIRNPSDSKQFLQKNYQIPSEVQKQPCEFNVQVQE